MAKGKRTGAGHSNRYTAYKNARTWEKNRRKKLQRALNRNPENGTIEAAMGSIVYRRKTPANKVWSATKRRTAILFKKFTGKFNNEIFSTNEKTAAAALMLTKVQKSGSYVEPGKDMFSIGVRLAHSML